MLSFGGSFQTRCNSGEQNWLNNNKASNHCLHDQAVVKANSQISGKAQILATITFAVNQ